MTRRTTLHLLASLPLVVAAGCSSPDEPVKLAPGATTTEATKTSTAAAPSAATARPETDVSKIPGHPPVASKKGLTFTAPPGWISEPPSVPMRRDQFKLPKQGSDKEDAAVTVSVLAKGEGGQREDNLKRWAQQFSQPDGRDSMEALVVSERKVGDLSITDIDIGGTYIAPKNMMDPNSARYDEAGWRMLMAWIQSDHGSYYVKLLGPQATVAHWEPSFRAYVSSVK